MNLVNVILIVSIFIYICALIWLVIYIWKYVNAFQRLEKEIDSTGLKFDCLYRIEKGEDNDACIINFMGKGIRKYPYISCIIKFDDGNIDVRKYKWDVIKDLFINNKIKIT